jgi:hypothetical protein
MPTIAQEIIVPLTQFVGTSPVPTTYGPFKIDKFTKDDIDKIRVWFAWHSNWPQIYPLFSLELYWDNGLGPFGGTFGGLQPTKFGIPQDGVGIIVGVPKTGNAKRNVTRGDISMKVYSTFSADIVIQALKDD